MCDPVSLTIASTAIGAAGSLANYAGAMSAQKKQEKEYNAWTQYQNKVRAEENVRQEQLRGKAEESRQKGVEDISAESQKERQAAEEARLGEYLADQDPAQEGEPVISTADASLSGQASADPQFQTDLAKKINEASTDAKKRMEALAGVQSFGGSFGGLGTTNPLLLQEAGSGIDAANEMRRGSLAAFGTEQNVDPMQFTYTPSPVADVFASMFSIGAQGLGGSLAGGAGGGLGKGVAGNVFPAAPSFQKVKPITSGPYSKTLGIF